MANDNNTQVIVEIIADTSGIEQNIQDVKDILNSIDGSGDAIFSDKSTKTVKDISSELDKATKNLKALNEAGKQNTKEFEAAKNEVIKLADEYKELNNQQAKLNTELKDANFSKLEGFGKIAAGGAGAVSGLAAGMQLFGVESEDALQSMAKLQALMGFAQGINGVKDLIEGFKQWKNASKAAAEAQEALNAIQGTGTQVTTGASGATKIFSTALKAIPILLIVAALGYLFTNFDKVKKVVSDTFPALGKLSDSFDTIKSTVMGVGNAILQFAIAPMKAIITLFTDGMSAAVQSYKDSLNVVANYKKGFDEQEKRNAADHQKQLIQNTIDANKRIIQIEESKGKDMTKLKSDNLVLEESLLTKQNEIEDKRTERIVLENAQQKKLADEAAATAKAAADKRKQLADQTAAQRKTELDALNKLDNDYAKSNADILLDARNKELHDLELKFQTEKAIYTKYNKDITNLEENRKINEAAINKKYDDKINDTLTATINANLNEYDTKIIEIKKKYEELYKVANPEQLKLLQDAQQKELDNASKANDLKNNSLKANIDLQYTVTENAPDETDTPDAAYNKKVAILEAQRKAADEDYKLKIDAARDNAMEIAQINADFATKNAELNQQDLQNQKDKAAAEKDLQDAKKATFNSAISSGIDSLNTFAEALGESTVAGKAMAIAAATISAIQGAVNAFTSMAVIPIVGPALGAVAAAAALTAGYMNIKKIAAVKVPGKASSSSAPSSIANASAPVVSSAVNNGSVSDVRVTNNPEDRIIKTYVTTTDINNKQEENNFLNRISTLGG